MRSPIRLYCLGLLALLATAASASAPPGPPKPSPDPSEARGINSGSLYGSFDIDTVNLFNGNVVVRIPLGQAFPVGPFLNQELVLTHNSKSYDYEYVLETVNDQTTYKRRAIPERASNAGWGWLVTMGQLVPPETPPSTAPPGWEGRPWLYRSPTGAEHEFQQGDANVEMYTQDGSYLRYRRYVNPDGSTLYREIEFPGGTVQRFDPQHRLIETRDRTGHWIRVGYSYLKWTITNGHGQKPPFRTTTVNFVRRTTPTGAEYTQANFQEVISSVVVPAFPDLATTGSAPTATYEFVYEDRMVYRDGCGDYIATDPPQFPAPVLTEVRLPANGGKYVVDYSPSGAACTAGLLRTMKLPSGGSIEWEHQPYELPKEECDEEHFWTVETPGLKRRILRDATGAVVGEWRYSITIDLTPPSAGISVACGEMDGNNPPVGPAPTEATTTVAAYEMRNGALVAVGGSTTHYFSAVRDVLRANALGLKTEEYGLPLTRRRPSATHASRFLSTERRDESGAVVRSTYLNYEGDGRTADGDLANARVQGDLTVFTTDTGCNGASCWTNVDRGEYAGYGNYRTSATTSNFGPARTSFTNYVPRPATWILNTYDWSWVEEGGVVAKQLSSFDDNGVLKTKRTLVGPTEHASKDLLEAFCRDGRGYLTAYKAFGGDGPGAFIPADPCAATPGATEYQVDYFTEFHSTNGAPLKLQSRFRDMTFFHSDVDLDPATGLVSVARDVSGVATTYGYDALGRVTDIQPTAAPWTHYAYTAAVGTTPATLHVSMRPAGATLWTPPFDERYIYYDWYGRVVQEKSIVPSRSGSRWSISAASFNFLGQQTTLSVPQFTDTSAYEPGFVPQKVTSTTFDLFGRATSITAPDGKQAFVSYAGAGTRQISRTAEVALSSGPAQATTTELYDAFGNLIQVTEPNNTVTRYQYDIGGHLSSVCQNVSGAGCGQTRTFNYDNRGYLTSESHPETNPASYTYDALGNLLSKTISGVATSPANLKFTYDSAGRLIQVDTQQPDGTYRPGKTFQFGTANAGTNKLLGKKRSATRFNYTAGALIQVTENFDYDEPAGRLSKTTTLISQDGDLLQKLEQGQSYDSSGKIGTITYPTCLWVACGAAAWNQRTRTFTHGLLTSVPGFADAITYTASGGVSTVDHAGPVTDTYTEDVTGARPKSITFAGYSACEGPSADPDSPRDAGTTPNGAVTLTFSATGATGYQWYEANGTMIEGATSASYTTPPLSSTKKYFAEAYNDCRTVKSREVTVNVCAALGLDAATPRDVQINVDETATLTVTAPGATWIQWYEGDTPIAGETNATFTTPPLTSTKQYYARVSNACWTETSRVATVTVNELTPPSGLVATVTTNGINLTWNSTGATRYQVERKSAGADYTPLQTANGNTMLDLNVAQNVTYVYRVRALSSTGAVTSAPSNSDLATTVTFSPISAGRSPIQAGYFDELLAAVNLVRAAHSTAPPLTWAAILPAGVAAPAPGTPILGQYVVSLRNAMDAARADLGLPPVAYSSPSVAGQLIRGSFVTEIRGGVQ